MYGSLTNHQIRLPSSSSHDTTGGVAVGEGETVFPVRHDPAGENEGLINSRPELISGVPGEIARIGYNIPGERHGDILVAEQSIAVVPEIILGVHRSVVQQGILPPEDNFIP